MTFVSLQDPFDTIDRTAIVAMRDESARGIRRRYCFLERFLVHDTRHPFNDNAGLLEFGSEHAPADVTTSSSGERPRPSAPRSRPDETDSIDGFVSEHDGNHRGRAAPVNLELLSAFPSESPAAARDDRQRAVRSVDNIRAQLLRRAMRIVGAVLLAVPGLLIGLHAVLSTSLEFAPATSVNASTSDASAWSPVTPDIPPALIRRLELLDPTASGLTSLNDVPSTPSAHNVRQPDGAALGPSRQPGEVRAQSPRAVALAINGIAAAIDALPATTLFLPGLDAPRASDASNAAELSHESGIRRALQSYQEAYGRLDVEGTADVWPSVDRRALARAFEGLESQGIDFQTCAVTVAGERATAQCRGTLRFVRKVGNALPLTAEQHWLFEMRRSGADWKIDRVTVTESRSGGFGV